MFVADMDSSNFLVHMLDDISFEYRYVERVVIHVLSKIDSLGNFGTVTFHKVVGMVLVDLVSQDLCSRDVLLLLVAHNGCLLETLGWDIHWWDVY